ncbi:MAG: flagellar biosynthesis anti-sigma factor FlgM [Candidatus Hydrogenedentes bacterium]|nr:flagellar biosynthesis anti-sigma factor FlgM [Candidatus Hydrogenedentota bacterium]
MQEIQGVGGVPRPVEKRPTTARKEAQTEETVRRQDDVSISQEARQAAEVARFVELAKSQDTVREDKVDEARRDIENGAHRDEQAVRETATRMVDDLV